MGNKDCEDRNACFYAGRRGGRRVCRLTGDCAQTLGGLACNSEGVRREQVNECARLAAKGISHRPGASGPVEKLG